MCVCVIKLSAHCTPRDVACRNSISVREGRGFVLICRVFSGAMTGGTWTFCTLDVKQNERIVVDWL